MSGALSMMEPTLRTRSVKITRTLPRLPVMVLADRIRLEQVIINLLRNALDATDAGIAGVHEGVPARLMPTIWVCSAREPSHRR